MNDLSILIHTKQRFPLRFSYAPASDSIRAALFLRPSTSDRKIGIETGSMLVFVSGDRAQRIRLHTPDDEGDGWEVWLAHTAFDIDEPTSSRLSAWVAQTLPGNDGSAPR